MRAVLTNNKLIFTNRSGVDRASLRAGVERLKAGDWLTIFPEGGITRSVVETAARGESTADLPFEFTRDEPINLFPARPGSAWMALQAGVPVLPIAFEGTEMIEAELTRLKRTEVKMHIRKPLGPFKIPAGVRGTEKKILIDRFGQEMMQGVANLLPERYRGEHFR